MPPYGAVPYARRDSRLSELILQSGQQQADAVRRGGEISGQMWAGLGQQFSNTLGDLARYQEGAPAREMAGLQLDEARSAAESRKQLQAQDAALMQLFDRDGLPDPQEVMRVVGPQRGLEIAKGLAAFQELQTGAVKDARDNAGRLAMGLKAAGPTVAGHLWPGVRQLAIKGGLGTDESIPQDLNPQFLEGVIAWASGEAPKQPEPFTLGPGQQRFGADGQPIAAVPAPAPRPVPVSEGGVLVDPTTGAIVARGPAKAPPTDNEPLVPVVMPDGTTVYKRRSEAEGMRVPSGASKPATGLEKRALNFFNRARQADIDVEGMEEQVRNLSLGGQVWMDWAPNFAQTELGQQYRQAQRAFTEARLRKDSGAAIPESEFVNDAKTYFAQPGDSKETLEQKRRSRAAVLASLGFESGQALGEFVGDSAEARKIVDDYKARAEKKTDAVPDLTGLQPGKGRKFRDGPFKGQTWSVDANGKPYKVSG